MIKVMIVDDHALVRLGLIEAIDAARGMSVVADLSSGKEALAVFGALEPDVVVMDFRMAEMDGVETTRRLLKERPGAKVMILSVYEGEEDVWRAISAGAMGYLSKGADTSDLLEAIEALHAGENYFPARFAQKILKRKGREALTAREMEVLELLVQGMSNKEISRDLSISLATVKLHISNVLEKMGVSDRTQAAIAAVQRGIVHLDD